jgi:hypothetical protein
MRQQRRLAISSQFPNFDFGCTLPVSHSMRRIFATIAFLLIGWTTVEPAALAALVSSSVPMCCRKGGKHHCSGSASDDDSTDGSIHLHPVAPVCPHRADALAPSAHFQFDAASEFRHQPLVTHSAVSTRDALGRLSPSSTLRFDRGPPQSSFSFAS